MYTLWRTPPAPPEALLRHNPLLNKAVTLLHDLVEVLRGPMPTWHGRLRERCKDVIGIG